MMVYRCYSPNVANWLLTYTQGEIMSHKQLYTEVFHLNPATIAGMGIDPTFYFLNSSVHPTNNDCFNAVVRLGTTGQGIDFGKFMPKGDIEIVSMTATNKYFFFYDREPIKERIDVTFEPFYTSVISQMIGFTAGDCLNILIKGPKKDEIPKDDNLYSELKAYTTNAGGYSTIPFNKDHLLNIDLVVNYTLKN